MSEDREKGVARNMQELLQELRVAQTGVQVLVAFLLTVRSSRPSARSARSS